MTTKHGGTLVFPNTWENIKQVESQPYTIDDKQMAQIRANVFDYFGVNEEILQAKATPEQFASYYEQTLEPFAIQFSDVVSKMTYTLKKEIVVTGLKHQLIVFNSCPEAKRYNS